MNKKTGYSLIEILLSLFLITSTILALMRHHWQISQQFNQTQIAFYNLIENDNQNEQQITEKTSLLQLGELNND